MPKSRNCKPEKICKPKKECIECPKFFDVPDQEISYYNKTDINFSGTGVNNPFYGWWVIDTSNTTLLRNVFKGSSQFLTSNANKTLSYIFIDTTNTNGYIQSIPIISGGAGYTTPTVTIPAPATGGIQATATATVVSGVITAINITVKGSNYTSPTVTISGTNTTPAVLGTPVIVPMVAVRAYIGTPELYRVPIPNYDLTTTPIYGTYQFQSPTELIENTDLNGSSPNSGAAYQGSTYKLTGDYNTLITNNLSQGEYYYDFQNVAVYKRIRFPLPTTNLSVQNDPIYLARYIVSLWKWVYNTQINKKFKNPDFVGIQKANEIIETFFTSGFTQTTPIRAIGCSSAFPYLTVNTEKLTDIYTGDKTSGLGIFSYATPGSTVTIKGFTGAWSSMNGVYKNGVAIREAAAIPNLDPHRTDSGPNGSIHNHYNHFLLNFDSSNRLSFPCNPVTLLSDFTGNPTITVNHKFRPEMEYPEFVAAIAALTYAIYRVNCHNSMSIYRKSANSMRMPDTWNDLRTQLLSSTATLPTNFRISQVRLGFFYQNCVLTGSTTALKYNESFGFSNAVGNPADYSLDMYNYLSEIRVLYFGIHGTLQADQPDPVIFSYPAVIPGPNRATFVGVLGNVNLVAGRPVPVNPDSSKYKLMGNKTSDAINAQSYYFGIINPQYTNGKKIGYIRWTDCNYADFLGYIATGLYAPENPATSTNPRNYIEAFCAVLSVMMSYFNTTQRVDNIIIDIRSNTGGSIYPYQALASFFGTDRTFFNQYVNRVPDINSQIIDVQNLDFVNKSTFNDNIVFKIYSSISSSKYPGSMFPGGTKSNPRQVIILDDVYSVSSGDIFPHAFLGEKQDGDMGNYTYGVVVGDCISQINGAQSAANNLPIPYDSLMVTFKTGTGEPANVLPINFDTPIGHFILYSNKYDPAEVLSGTFPNKVPGIKGTSGVNALPHSWFDTICYDVGGLTPYPEPRLPGDSRPQNPVFSDRSTWRDRWLEAAIRQCLFGVIDNRFTLMCECKVRKLRSKTAGERLSKDGNGCLIYPKGFYSEPCNNPLYNTIVDTQKCYKKCK